MGYSQFQYSNASLEGIIISRGKEGKPVIVEVKNLGKVRGAETVQVYVVPQKEGNAVRPVKTLADFNEVLVELGYEYEIHIIEKGDLITFWDAAEGKWAVSKGTYELLVASSSSPRYVRVTLNFKIDKGFSFKRSRT